MLIKILRNIYHELKYYFLVTKSVFINYNHYFIINPDDNYELFFTHNLGGGTELFSNRYIASNSNVLRISNCSYAKKNLYFIVENTDQKIYFRNVQNLFNFIEKLPVSKITVNSFVSCFQIDFLIKKIINLSMLKKAPIMYMIHDFHCLCPTVNLIHDNFYCNLRCEEFNCKFNLFENFTNTTISNWRKMWNEFLLSSSEIRTFSQSSKELVIKAFPFLDINKITVIPHDLSYFITEKVDTKDYPLHIGVFGNCNSIPKGRLVIKELAKQCRKKNIPIIFAGKYRFYTRLPYKNVTYLGPYNHSEMRKIIIDNKISIVFFPSICPETFSYLVSELIALDVPVICFNFGAQAEKIRNYSKGIVCYNFNQLIKLITTYE